ncbi:GPW/gp25 family protein [Methylobacterium aquaticum]|uniref:GPW/gp25 family protein n=1 Tax=Methylobacterium aquaticum TaxID=270351 RepID=A0A0C6FXT7_9HYPH|nr:GPW/gp25 family protein [Methylobacterium aquaticum]BAQ50419.1 GPW/gp25 family protein [Methylobacterium aquaticum]
MASCGLDRETGEPLYDLDHVYQSVGTLLTTRLAEMITLEWFGGGLAEILGRRLTPRLIDLYRTLLALAIRTWEPRLQVVRVYVPSATEANGNTLNAVTLGQIRFAVLAYYRPRGHLGDFTVEGGLRTFVVAANDNRLSVTLAAA